MTSYSPTNLGSSRPPGGVDTELGMVYPLQNAYVTLFVANSSDTVTERVRVALMPAGFDPPGEEHWIAYDTPVEPNYMFQLAYIGLDNQARIWVRSESGFATFNAVGNQFINP